MSKKFVVAFHGPSHYRDPITTYFLGREWHVWHWYPDFWLLNGVPDELTAGSVYAELKRAVPAITFASLIVIEMGPELRYYGTAPMADAWPWMSEHWGTPDVPTSDSPKHLASEPEGTHAVS